MNARSGVLLGASLGALLGLLVGLASAPVVAAVIGSLLTVAGGVFGLASEDSILGPQSNDERKLRVVALCGFALAMALAVMVGIYLRAHQSLSPSPAERAAAWTDAGFSAPMAHMLTAYQITGVLPSGFTSNTIDARFTSTLLYSGNREACDRIDPEELPDLESWRIAITQVQNGWQRLAAATEGLTTQQQTEIFQSAWRLACGD